MSADVTVIILHREAAPAAGPLVRRLAFVRADQAERHRRGFLADGARVATVVAGAPDDRPFGARLRPLVAGLQTRGLVVLGSGAIPLATRVDRTAFVEAADAPRVGALANDRYSADIVAVADARTSLAALPDLRSDNALPRWLEGSAAIPVADLRDRWRLGVDIDSPLDLALLGGRWASALAPDECDRTTDALAGVRAAAADARAELVVTGRTSASSLAWLERHTAARVRAVVEERGLRTSVPGQRAPKSVLGAVLDRDGPGSLGEHLARLGEAALIDTRVLLAHRLGADERGWPSAEDRFASDLLLHERIANPWLRELTAAAVAAPIPVLLGGHTLVGPGIRLVFRMVPATVSARPRDR